MWVNGENISGFELNGVFSPEITLQIKSDLDGEDSLCAVFDGPIGEKGALLVTLNRYDSDFLKTRIGKVKYYGDNISQQEYSKMLRWIMEEANREEFKYLFYPISETYGFLREETLKQGFGLCCINVDQRLDLRNGYDRRPERQSDYKTRDAVEADIGAIKEIATGAFRRSRLYKMEFVEEKVMDDYHNIWVQNIIEDKDDIMLVVEHESKVYGFLSIRPDAGKRTARFILGAVDKTQRRKGLWHILVNACFDRVIGKVDFVYAKTQEDNVPSINSWKNYGFETVGYEYGYHKQESGT